MLRCCKGTGHGKQVLSHPCKCAVDNAVVLPLLNYCHVRETVEWLEWQCKIYLEFTEWIDISSILSNAACNSQLHLGSTVKYVGVFFYGC